VRLEGEEMLAGAADEYSWASPGRLEDQLVRRGVH